MVFLIFDVEVGLLLPLALSQAYMIILFTILFVGLVYEWYYGGLDWIYVNRFDPWDTRCRIVRDMTNYMVEDRS